MSETAPYKHEEETNPGREVKVKGPRGKFGKGVMAVMGHVPGMGEGRHSNRKSQAARVPDASGDTFSRDPFSGGRHEARPAVRTELPAAPAIEAPVAEAVHVEVPTAVATEQTPSANVEEFILPAASNIRHELPTGEHGSGAVAADIGHEARHAAPDMPVEADHVPRHAAAESAPQLVGSDLVHQGHEAPAVVEHNTDSDPNVIGSKAWHAEHSDLPQRTPGAEYHPNDDVNVLGSAAWHARQEAMVEADHENNYGPATEVAAPVAVAPETTTATSTGNVLARVYNNIRSHKSSHGRHAAVGRSRRFSFLSRAKGKHGA